MQILEFLRKISSWFIVRLACFVGLAAVAQHVPGWAKRPLWLTVLFVGVWAFVALIRESKKALDLLVPVLQQWRSILERPRDLQRIGRIIRLLCAAAIIAIAVFRAWPVWSFKATSSLRDDEIMGIVRFTSRGFVPAISTYNLARNHVFYNVVSSLIPGANSTAPLRARLLSFISVLGALALLIAYAAKRHWLLPGLAIAGFVAGNSFAMDSLLEARGYGFIFLFAMLGSVAFSEWVRTRSSIWLKVMAISCVLGAYTLPFYLVFGGGLLLVSFLHRPSRETLLAGFLSLAAITMLYLPIAAKIYAVFSGYSDRYAKTFFSSFQSMDGVFGSFQYFIPHELLQIGALSFTLITLAALLYMAFGRFAEKYDRLSFAGIVGAILAFLAFCLYCRIVPIRVASYMSAPMAFLAVLVTGSILSSRFLTSVRPHVDVLFTVLAAVIMLRSEIAQPLIARADWRELGVLIERAFPKDIRIWSTGDSPRLLQWNLSSRAQPETGALDRESLRAGKLVAVEDYTRPTEEKLRLRWEQLPEDVRFVTSPLSLNYHRVFFVPPAQSRISSISVDNQPIQEHVSGRQPYDPGLFVHSHGHGDVLRPENAGHAGGIQGAEPAQPTEIRLPTVITVELEPGTSAGTCNLLFTQSLQDKIVTASISTSKDDWRIAKNVFILGELASIALNRDGSKAIRVRVENGPVPSPATPAARPPFGLLNAWIAPGKDRLP